MSQDVLESGVERPRRPRRRLAVLLGVLVLAASGFWLAGRSNPDREPLATPAPSVVYVPVPPPPPTGPQPQVVDVAVGADAAYVLVGRCTDAPSRQSCTLELLIGSGTGDWRPAGVDLRHAGQGLATRLQLGDGLAIVDEDARVAYLVRGGSVVHRPVTAGRPVAALPAGSVLDGDDRRLLAFDPATGVRAPLATQPPFGMLQQSVRNGRTIAVVGGGQSGPLLALSRDGGRHWAAARVPTRRPGPQLLRLALGSDGTVYVMTGRETHEDVRNEFTELWRFSGGAWRDVTPRVRPKSASSIVLHGSQLLLTEETGGLWRLRPDGRLQRMPDPVSEGAPVRPTYLVTGPPGILLAYADIGGRSAVLSSPDGGAHWAVYLPA